MICQVEFLIRVGVLIGLCDNSRVLSSNATEPLQEPSGSLEIAQQTEIVAEHQEGLELSQMRADPGDRQEPGFSEASFATGFDSQRRAVDAGYIESFLLQIKADSSGSAAYIQHSTGNEFHRLLVVPRPVFIL